MTRAPSVHPIAERRGALILAIVFTLAILAAAPPAGAQAMARAVNRSYTNNRTALFMGEVLTDWLKVGNIVQSASPSGPTSTVAFTTGRPSTALTHFEQAALAGDPVRGVLRIETTDYDFRPQSVLVLSSPRIQEIDLPTVDAASKNAAQFTVKFFPAPSRSITPPAGSPPLKAPAFAGLMDRMLASNFRLEIAGIDCSRVATVSALTVTFPSVLSGSRARPTYTPLVISVSKSAVGPFQQWLAAPGPKDGKLVWLSPDLKTPLYEVVFTGLRIQTIADETSYASQNIARSTVTMSIGHLAVERP